MGDRFFRQLLQGSAPLMVWALHFFAVYVLAEAGCGRAFEPALRWALPMASVLALATIALMLLLRRLRVGGRSGESVLRTASLGSGVLALIGVLWTSLPMLWLPPCGWP